jgi:hypothetical protein
MRQDLPPRKVQSFLENFLSTPMIKRNTRRNKAQIFAYERGYSLPLNEREDQKAKTPEMNARRWKEVSPAQPAARLASFFCLRILFV